MTVIKIAGVQEISTHCRARPHYFHPHLPGPLSKVSLRDVLWMEDWRAKIRKLRHGSSHMSFGSSLLTLVGPTWGWESQCVRRLELPQPGGAEALVLAGEEVLGKLTTLSASSGKLLPGSPKVLSSYCPLFPKGWKMPHFKVLLPVLWIWVFFLNLWHHLNSIPHLSLLDIFAS